MTKAFDKGVTALEHGSFDLAHRAFDEACQASPSNACFPAYRAWARYLSVTSTPKNRPTTRSTNRDRWLGAVVKKNCRSVIETAVAQQRDFAMGYYFLGKMSLEEHDPQQAHTLLRKALRLLPQDEQIKLALGNVEAMLPKRRPTWTNKLVNWFSSSNATSPQ